MHRRLSTLALVAGLALAACKKHNDDAAPAPSGGPATSGQLVGFVTDVAGRGDHSFNDSGLRGLELWGGGKLFEGGRYRNATAAELAGSIPADLASRGIKPVGIKPLILQSKAQEDYEPNLQLVVDQGAALTVACGFMLENAVEQIAKRNPQARFLLIDSRVLDKDGKPIQLPNVRTVVFREEEGSFLVGALAGLTSRTGQIGFVGGMEIPLIKRFEAGFRAGVLTTRPDAAAKLVVSYTGSFDNVAAGKPIAQDMLAKGVDVIFQAAGLDGLGVIQAVKEAKAAGKTVYAIGVDSDQHHVAPEVMLTSMVKRVDLAVYEAIRDLHEQKFQGGDLTLGLSQQGVTMAEVRHDFPAKEEALKRVDALRAKIAAGELKVPSTLTELQAYKAGP